MIYLKLFIAFVKIGLFSFGGGYAMIPLMQKEIEINNWLTPSEFADIIAISEMTPGPVAVNSATYIGYKTAGVLGGAAATLGVAAPSLILILIVCQFFYRFKQHPLNEKIFYGIRPVVAGLIATAAIFISQTALFNEKLTFQTLKNIFITPLDVINIESIAILLLTIFSIKRLKIHPILCIIFSAFLGVFFFYVL